MKTDREIAIAWWRELSFENQYLILNDIPQFVNGKFIRNPITLTGREIEIIWKHENNN